MTPPPLRPDLVPRFHEFGDDEFEDLCRELAQEEHDDDVRRQMDVDQVRV